MTAHDELRAKVSELLLKVYAAGADGAERELEADVDRVLALLPSLPAGGGDRRLASEAREVIGMLGIDEVARRTGRDPLYLDALLAGEEVADPSRAAGLALAIVRSFARPAPSPRLLAAEAARARSWVHVETTRRFHAAMGKAEAVLQSSPLPEHAQHREKGHAMHCCMIDCPAVAEFAICDEADRTDTAETHACRAHVGDLLGHGEGVPAGAPDRWRVESLDGGVDA